MCVWFYICRDDPEDLIYSIDRVNSTADASVVTWFLYLLFFDFDLFLRVGECSAGPRFVGDLFVGL